MDGEMEARHLSLADHHIALGRSHIAAQQTLVDRLRAEGRDSAVAEELLALFQDTLAAWEAHRSLITACLTKG